MGALGRISRATFRPMTHEQHGDHEPGQSPEHAARIAVKGRSQQGTTNSGKQRDSVGKVGCLAHTAVGNGDGHAFADTGPEIVVHPVTPWPAGEHPGQALSAATALLMTSPTTALLDLDLSLPTVNCPDHAANRATAFVVHAHQRRSGAVSSKGRKRRATASRARKMRERTVPIGQFMMLAISS